MTRRSHPPRNVWLAVTGGRGWDPRRMRRLAAGLAAIVVTIAAVTASPASASGGPDTPRDHVWIPSLGIDRPVHLFPCPRQQPPDDLIYSWGCAGENNVYLLGHAQSVFRPLHDAYVAGRLSEDLTVVYADDHGIFHVYRVAWWRLTRPTPDANWAWAPQDRPSMTLQTCVGADSEYRLMVRLVEVRGEATPRSQQSQRTSEQLLHRRVAHPVAK